MNKKTQGFLRRTIFFVQKVFLDENDKNKKYTFTFIILYLLPTFLTFDKFAMINDNNKL